jgi:hypothetical protein
MSRGKRSGLGALGVAAVTLAVGLPSPVASQSASDRRSASDAYDRGSEAYLAEDWGPAAPWFELAYRFTPAAPALVQAVRSHRRAGELERAATLSLRLQGRHAADPTAQETATEVLEEAERVLYRVEVRCTDCTVLLDGALLDHPAFFAAPMSSHTVVGSFPTGNVSATVTGTAGQRRVLQLEAPPPAAQPEPAVEAPPSPAYSEDSTSSASGLPLGFFLGAAGLTAVAASILVWSSIDTLAGVDDYEAGPTTDGLAAGQAKEDRTNVMIGVTTALGALALGLLFFTDWGGDEDVTPSVAISDGTVGLLVHGRLP